MSRDDLAAKPTQAALARVSGLTEGRISQIHADGVLKGDTLLAWLRCLVRHLGEHAAGRAGELADERARLAAAQADRVEMENAVTRGDLAPRSLLEATLSDVVQQMVPLLEGIPAQVKRASSTIKARELAVVKREIDKARHAMADAKIP